MIPPFDPFTGNLPPGIHQASWEEFRQRFGLTPHRRSLLEKLFIAAADLAQCGCKRVYVDGSFVTASDIPGDYDMCWEVEGVNTRTMRQMFPGLGYRSRAERNVQKRVCEGDIFPASGAVTFRGSALVEILDYFQIDKFDETPKGIVMIELVTEL